MVTWYYLTPKNCVSYTRILSILKYVQCSMSIPVIRWFPKTHLCSPPSLDASTHWIGHCRFCSSSLSEIGIQHASSQCHGRVSVPARDGNFAKRPRYGHMQACRTFSNALGGWVIPVVSVSFSCFTLRLWGLWLLLLFSFIRIIGIIPYPLLLLFCL
jgi:hypothetical protein